MANIAEGFMRGGNKEFIQFLFIARDSIGEIKSYLYFAMAINYITIEQFNECENTIKELLSKIDAFILYLKRTENKGIKFNACSCFLIYSDDFKSPSVPGFLPPNSSLAKVKMCSFNSFMVISLSVLT
mgnify:CR=1 FL=1